MLVHSAILVLGWILYDYSPTFYQCVKCMKAVCNRPTCSTNVSVDTEGYQEDPPKRISNVVTVRNLKILKSMQRKNKLIYHHFSLGIIPFSLSFLVILFFATAIFRCKKLWFHQC